MKPNQMKLLNLGIRNAQEKKQQPALKNMDDGSVEIYIYDVIDDWWGVAAEELVKEIAQIEASEIKVRINSPGGDVFAAVAIHNALMQHPAKIVVHVDGLAASAASYIAMAGDERLIAQGGFVMIHKAWTWSAGNADDMRTLADRLDKIDGAIRGYYCSTCTDLDEDEVMQMMADETWLNAEECIEKGFMTGLIGDDSEALENNFDLSVYDKVPEKITAVSREVPAGDQLIKYKQRLIDMGQTV